MILDKPFHVPVLLPTAIEALQVGEGKNYIDATCGGGGHSLEIIRRKGKLLAIDTDSDAINYFRNRLKKEGWEEKIGKDIFLTCANYRRLKEVVEEFNFRNIAGIIFDLGVSTYQLVDAGRGFSYRKNEDLDMRMCKTGKITVIDIINKFSAGELYEIFSTYSEELHSRAIADAIVRTRTVSNKISKTGQLKDIIMKTVREKNNRMDFQFLEKQSTRVLSRIFQALRIYVNAELESLKQGLDQAIELLIPGGRLAVISYHSLEDRITKLTFKRAKEELLVKLVNKHPIFPAESELKMNPKSRSAKLRIAEKL